MKFNLCNIATAFALSTLLLSGCSSTDEKLDGFVDETAGIDNPNKGTSTQGYDDKALSGSEYGGYSGSEAGGGYSDNGEGYGSVASQGGGPNGTKTIYFMYDSSQVMEEFVPVIAAHAQSLKSNPGQHIIIEGHTDQRGSREYNIALGEQRAKAVSRMLTLQGVPQSQIEVVSYGEEKPASEGNDESAWQLNRRAEIDYQGQ